MYKAKMPISQKDKLEFWAKRKANSLKIATKLLNKEITLDEVPNRYPLGQPKKNKAMQVVLPEYIDNAPVYILIRTHHRPEYFKRCMDSIKMQDYPNIKTIIHSDDPRDTYAQGDIVIKGHCYHPKTGTGPYNLYNNRLLDAIPDGWGWYHFIDDDDVYYSKDVISRLVKSSKVSAVNVGKVTRWHGTVWPRSWKTQRSYQTECFFMHAAYKSIGKWWANKSGDHYYSRQLTDQLPINWIENLMICKAQEGKNRGEPVDLGKKRVDYTDVYDKSDIVYCMVVSDKLDIAKSGNFVEMKYGEAVKLEKKGWIKITHKGVTVEDNR